MNRVPTSLSRSQVARFQGDGFVVVPAMFSADEMDAMERWTDEVVAFPEVPGRHMVYYEDSLLEPGRRVLSRIENFCAYHAGFERLLNGPRALAPLGDLFAEPAVLFKDKINFKLPGGSGFKAHQDVQAGWDRYASLHITLLVSIDDADAENGCLEIAPGQQRRGLIGAMWEPLDESRSDLSYASCPTRRGDGVLFDSYTPHRSGPNLSGKPRRVLYVTYNRASEGDHRAQYYADKRLSYPPDCERDPAKSYVFRV